MATVLLTPSQEGSYTTASLGAGASKTEAVSGSDDDTSYIYTRLENQQQSFVTGLNKPVGVSSVTAVYGFMRFKRMAETGDNGNCQMFAAFGATLGGASSAVTPGTSYGNVTSSSLSRPGGGAWTVSDIYNSTLGVSFYRNEGQPSGSGNTIRVTWMLLNLDVKISSPGFSFLAGSLVGAALGLSELPGLADAIYRRTGTLITPDEYLEAWKDIRWAKRPKSIWAPAV